MKPCILLRTGVLLCMPVCLCAADPPVVKPDPDLPQPLSAQLAESLLTNPPFTRALNLSNSLALTGIAYVEGKPVATLVNRETKESFVVSEEPNAQGWKLAQTNASTELKRTEVKIMAGAEIVTVRYGDDQLTPEAKKGSMPGRSGGGPPPDAYRSDGSIRTSSYLGDNGRERYYALSDQARDRLRAVMQQRREQMPNASFEEHAAFARKEFERIEAEDRRNRGR